MIMNTLKQKIIKEMEKQRSEIIKLLKPTLFNISLFLIIGFLAIFVGSNFFEYLSWLTSEIRTITFYPNFNPLFWFPLLKLTPTPLFLIFSQGRIKEIILPLFVNVIYWYFLSCLITFIYTKFKKSKRG